MHTDPIADLLTRIRNAIKAHHQTTDVPHSGIKENILKVMKQHGFIENYEVSEERGLKVIEITLKENAQDLIFKKISKPGQRIYIKNSELKPVKSGLGISIISTSKGIMSNSEAKKLNIGGEIICEIY